MNEQMKTKTLTNALLTYSTHTYVICVGFNVNQTRLTLTGAIGQPTLVNGKLVPTCPRLGC